MSILQILAQEDDFLEERARNRSTLWLTSYDAQSQSVFHLSREDEGGNACSEACGHGTRDQLDSRTKTRQPHQDQHSTRKNGADDKLLRAILVRDANKDGDECSGWSTNCHLATASCRDEETSDNSRGETDGWGRFRGDPKCHREGQGNDTDCDATQDILSEIL